MPNPSKLLFLIATLAFTASLARGVTVRTIEDKDINGQLVSLEAGTLTVAVKNGDTVKRESVRLDEIVSINLRGLFEPTVVTTQPATQPEMDDPVVRPANAVPWRATLLSGERLTGYIDRWTKTTVTLASPALGKPVEVPLPDVKEIWRPGASRQDVPASIKLDGGLEDVALVKAQSDGRIQDVRGTVVALTDAALTFRYGGEDRQIDPARLVGLVLATREYTPTDRLRQSFVLDSGDIVTGEWMALKGDVATVRTGWKTDVNLPLAQVARINVVNGRLAYLSDMTPIKVEQTPYFDRVLPYRIDGSLRGGKGLTMLDGTHAKGIAMHSRCLLHYDIGGKFETFRAKLGVLQPEGKLGRAAVRVLGDGKSLYDNPDLRGDQMPIDVELKLTGVRRLTLEVDYGRGQDVGDHVGWAEPKLLRPAMK